MAESASGDRVERDMRPPKYREAVQLVRHGFEKLKATIAEKQQKIGETWGKIEGYGVNRQAAKWFATLDKKEPVERNDILRSLNGLIDAAAWDQTDLVDASENQRVGGGDDDDEEQGAGEDDQTSSGDTVVHGRFARTAEEEARGQEAVAAGGPAEFDEAEGQKGASVAARAAERREQLRTQGAAPEPYTGDNSDLAGEDAA